MTDRELLELAAKAADYTIRFHIGVCKGGAYEGCERLWPDGEWRPWRPRQDDGDAFRLAVALGITVQSDSLYRDPFSSARIDPRLVPVDARLSYTEDHNGDRLAATRRAIVRAAAEIQRAREAG